MDMVWEQAQDPGDKRRVSVRLHVCLSFRDVLVMEFVAKHCILDDLGALSDFGVEGWSPHVARHSEPRTIYTAASLSPSGRLRLCRRTIGAI